VEKLKKKGFTAYSRINDMLIPGPDKKSTPGLGKGGKEKDMVDKDNLRREENPMAKKGGDPYPRTFAHSRLVSILSMGERSEGFNGVNPEISA